MQTIEKVLEKIEKFKSKRCAMLAKDVKMFLTQQATTKF